MTKMPKPGDEFYFVSVNCSAVYNCWCGDDIDMRLWKSGNVFRTWKDAAVAAHEVAVLLRYRRRFGRNPLKKSGGLDTWVRWILRRGF